MKARAVATLHILYYNKNRIMELKRFIWSASKIAETERRGEHMNLAAISYGSSSAVRYYAYGGTYLHQLPEVPVTPVSRIGRLAPLSGEQGEYLSVSYEKGSGEVQQVNAQREADYIDAVRASYSDEEQVSYRNRINPYDRERMSAEGAVLSGMYVNLLA